VVRKLGKVRSRPPPVRLVFLEKMGSDSEVLCLHDLLWGKSEYSMVEREGGWTLQVGRGHRRPGCSCPEVLPVFLHL
jgi:hypothetical protein